MPNPLFCQPPKVIFTPKSCHPPLLWGDFYVRYSRKNRFLGPRDFGPKWAILAILGPNGPFWAAVNMGSPPISKDGTGPRGQNGPQSTLKPLLGGFLCQVFAEKSIFGTPGFWPKMSDFGYFGEQILRA